MPAILVACASLPFLLVGAVVCITVANLKGARIAAFAWAGAAGGLIGGWLVRLLVQVAVRRPDPVITWGSMLLGAFVGSLILTIPIARQDKGTKPPSSSA
jgi:hypothetical protein